MNRLGQSSDSVLRLACLKESTRVTASLRHAGILTKSQKLEDFMYKNKLADTSETVFDVFSRVSCWLAQAGAKYYGDALVKKYEDVFISDICKFKLIPGSPMLTNAGRRVGKSVSACSIPPVHLSKMSREEIAKIVGDYHTRGMGTGFSLDELDDPVSMVKYLNELAIREVQSGKIERSCGNMGVLSIDHPKILEFIRLKTANPDIREWKFNISVNVTSEFLEAERQGTAFYCKDGTQVDPRALMRQIAESAHGTGDPGLIFMDRINSLNRVPQAGQYKTVVPCGEVSLFEGEVCQFAYINLTRFVVDQQIDKESLKDAVHTLVLLLDNAVEANIDNMPNEESSKIIASLRRIGIGVCGFAEVLHALGLAYDSPEGIELARNIMSVINYESKKASILLAGERGPFELFKSEQTKKELFIKPFKAQPTSFVSTDEWEELEFLFENMAIRNVATTILPPSGRSSLLAGVTASIEPPFRLNADAAFEEAFERSCSLYGYQGDRKEIYSHIRKTGSVQETDLPSGIKDIYKSALEISPEHHIAMTAAFQQQVDEGISKTVNLPHSATVDDVVDIFRACYDAGLKGMTVYRDGSRTLQPKSLHVAKESAMSLEVTVDTLYGPIRVSQKIASLLKSSLVSRLKGIKQNGCAYLIDPRQDASRHDHSVGVLALAKLLGASESQQIAALLHDISHTAFSHVIDLVFENSKQNYHDLKRAHFLNSDEGKKIIEEFGLTEKELRCDKIPLVKGEGLNLDRLDYCIRDLLAVGRIFQPEYASILHNLVVTDEGRIACKDIETARLVFNKFLEVNEKVYFDPKVEAASVALATIIKGMLHEGLLSEDDLFATDDLVLQKIEASHYKDMLSLIGTEGYAEDTPEATPAVVWRKLRVVDPIIVGLEGTLTECCVESNQRLERYLQTDTKVLYKVSYSMPHNKLLLEKFT